MCTAADVDPDDPDDPEPIRVHQLDALPWVVRWMRAGEVEAGGMVVALAGAESAEPLFGALEVRALAAAGAPPAAGLGTRRVPAERGGGVRRRQARVSEFR